MKALTVLFLAAMLLACSKEPIDIPLEKGWYVENRTDKPITAAMGVSLQLGEQTEIDYYEEIIDLQPNERVYFDFSTLYHFKQCDKVILMLHIPLQPWGVIPVDRHVFEKSTNWIR
jgi:hypothetical protein